MKIKYNPTKNIMCFIFENGYFDFSQLEAFSLRGQNENGTSTIIVYRNTASGGRRTACIDVF